MPPLTHFMFGYTLTFLLALLLGEIVARKYLSTHPRMLWVAVFISVICGIIADIPDFGYIMTQVPEPASTHHQPWTDFCFFHQRLDDIVIVNDFWFSVEMFVGFVSVNFYALIFILDPFRAMKQIIALDKKSEDFRYLY